MKIAHIATGMSMAQASFRYRMLIPGAELKRRGHSLTLYKHSSGVKVDADVAIFMKHYSPDDIALAKELRGQGVRVVYDVCDNHFASTKFGPHYRGMIEQASLVTCPTEEMARIVREQSKPSGDVLVIPDPFEFPERRPHASEGEKLCWFGHGSNIHEIAPLMFELRQYELSIVSGGDLPIAVIPWSVPNLMRVFERSHIALVMSKKKTASANRVIEALRSGLAVVASDIPPSYLPFREWMYVGQSVLEGLAWMKEHRHELDDRVAGAQSYIAKTFAPLSIAKEWERALS